MLGYFKSVKFPWEQKNSMPSVRLPRFAQSWYESYLSFKWGCTIKKELRNAPYPSCINNPLVSQNPWFWYNNARVEKQLYINIHKFLKQYSWDLRILTLYEPTPWNKYVYVNLRLQPMK